MNLENIKPSDMDDVLLESENINKNVKVFLGGTCNNSKWRDYLIPMLKINYFNPVVDEWTEEAQQNEINERKNDTYVLYTITPLMTGVYSIAEVVDDSNKRPNKTIFCILEKDQGKTFEKFQIKSLRQVGKMVEENGGKAFDSLEAVAKYLNGGI